jgi:ADP-heptose:LPS heptosyltransferase
MKVLKDVKPWRSILEIGKRYMGRKPYILVVRQLGGIGDVLMLSCLFRGLKEKYPGHTLKCVTAEVYLSGSLMDIMTHNPLIDEVIAIEPWDMTPARTREVWGRFYAGAGHLEDELIWKMADHAFDMNTACVDYEWEAMKNGGIQKPRYQVWCDAADLQPSSYAPIYRVNSDELSKARAYADEHWKGATVVGLGLSACDKKRALGVGKLQEICQGLNQAGVHVVTIDPTNRLDGVDSIIGKRISELMALISCMDVVISADSGILHMAGALGIPVVGLFGPTDYKMRMGCYLGSATDSTRLVDCAPCWYEYPCADRGNGHKPFECLSKIPVSGIVEETLRWAEYQQSGRH